MVRPVSDVCQKTPHSDALSGPQKRQGPAHEAMSPLGIRDVHASLIAADREAVFGNWVFGAFEL
jgi:hypothetical protein